MRTGLFLVCVVALFAGAAHSQTSLPSSCYTDFQNSFGTAGTQVNNFQCFEFSARYSINFDRRITFTADKATTTDYYMYYATGTCATHVLTTGLSTTFAASAVNMTGITSTAGSLLTLSPGGVSSRFKIAAADSACVCFGSYLVANIRFNTGPAKGALTRVYGAQEEMVMYNGGAFAATSATTAWTLTDSVMAQGTISYSVNLPIVNFNFPAEGDGFTGYYPIYVASDTVNSTVVTFSLNRFGENTAKYASKVTLSQSVSSSIFQYTISATSFTWAAGETGNKTATVTISPRSSADYATVAVLSLTGSVFSDTTTKACSSIGFASIPLRISVSGCSGGPTCDGGGVCSAASKTTFPSCVCNPGYTSQGGTCTLASGPATSSTPVPVPSVRPSQPSWNMRTLTSKLSNSSDWLTVTSTSTGTDTSSRTSIMDFAFSFSNGGDFRVTASTSYKQGSAVTYSDSMRLRVIGIIEFRDVNGNRRFDSGELVQLYRPGRDSRPPGALGICCVAPSSTVTWGYQEFSRTEYGINARVYTSDSIFAADFYVTGGGVGSEDAWVPTADASLMLSLNNYPLKATDGKSRLALAVAVETDGAAISSRTVDPIKFGSRIPLSQVAASTNAFTYATVSTNEAGISGPRTKYMPVDATVADISSLDPALVTALNSSSAADPTTKKTFTVQKAIIMSFDQNAPLDIDYANLMLGLREDLDVGSSTPFIPGDFGPNGSDSNGTGNDDGSNSASATMLVSCMALALSTLVLLAF